MTVLKDNSRWMVVVVAAVILLMTMETTVEAQRGKTRARVRGNPGGIMMTNYNQDANSKMDYYNNPLGAKIIKASHFDFEYILGHKVTFLCEAQGDPRPQITWFKDGLEIFAHPFMQLHEWKTGENSTKSKMEIDPATQMDAGLYECHANNKYTIDRRSFKADFSIED